MVTKSIIYFTHCALSCMPFKSYFPQFTYCLLGKMVRISSISALLRCTCTQFYCISKVVLFRAFNCEGATLHFWNVWPPGGLAWLVIACNILTSFPKNLKSKGQNPGIQKSEIPKSRKVSNLDMNPWKLALTGFIWIGNASPDSLEGFRGQKQTKVAKRQRQLWFWR